MKLTVLMSISLNLLILSCNPTLDNSKKTLNLNENVEIEKTTTSSIDEEKRTNLKTNNPL